MTHASGDEDKVAIIGMAGRFPGAPDAGALWEQAVSGRVDVSTVAGGQPGTVPARGVLGGTDRFDAGFFGVPAREAAMMDPQQRFLLEVVQHGLDDAGIDPARAGCPVSVYLSCGPSQAGNSRGSLSERYERDLASAPDFAATRISYRLGLRGESMTVQTGCSSSLVAVHLAVQSLLSGQSDVAIAGGASFQADQSAGYGVEDGMITSPTGRCRPFDAGADGTVPGGGVAIVVLRRLPDAMDDGANIHAVIIGSAVNNDGATKVGFMAPSPAGQAEVIATAHSVAGVPAGSIGYVETHGTATKLGDAAEIEGLREAFAVDPHRRTACALGSLKANAGHLDRAAGVAGLIRAAMAVGHGVVPPMAGLRTPNPDLGLHLASFVVPTAPSAWPIESGPRRAGVSAFGVGGTNAHVVIEQAPPRPRTSDGPASVLLAVSAKSAAAAAAQSAELAGHLDRNPDLPLADVASTLAAGRRQHDYRTAVVAADLTGASAALRAPAPASRAAHSPSVVFAFTGQGEDVVDGLRELYDTEPAYRSALEECARGISAHGGPDVLAELYGDRPEPERVERFRDMGRFQPALFAVEWALTRLLASWSIRADAVIGHSVGEVAAAAYAGVFALQDACALIVERGRRMEQTAPGMTISVTMAAGELRRRLPEGVSIAAMNGGELTTATGSAAAVRRLAAGLAADGVTVRHLHIHRCPHGPAMAPAAGHLRVLAAKLSLQQPNVPLLSNVTGDWAGEDVTTAGYWARHLCSPVRFTDQLRRIAELPSPVVAEVGPGGGLSRIIAHELGDTAITAVPLAGTRMELLDGLGRLWAAGAWVDIGAANGGGARRIVSLPPTRFDHSTVWPAQARPAPSEAARQSPTRHTDPAAWLYQPALVPVAVSPPAASSRVLWAGGGGALRAAVAKAAASAGCELTVVDHAGLPGLDGSPAELLWWAGDAGEGLLPRAAELAEALAKAGAAPRVWVVTPVAGGERLRPAAANLAHAAALVVPQEYPGLRWRAIEVDTDAGVDLAAGYLLGCVTRPSPGPVTRAGPGGAFEVALQRAWPDWRTRPLRDGGCYVITGGLGLVGRALSQALAREVACTIVLLGRRPAGEAAGELDALAHALRPLGTSVEYHQVDVTDATGTATLFGRLRERFGRIDGVVHAAGFTDTSRFPLAADCTPELVAGIAGAKLAGAVSVRDALHPGDADFVLLCSSLSVVLGGVRFAAYIAANAALDDFAASRHERGDRRWVSVAWDAWAEPGAPGDIGPGRYALSTDEGYEVFRRVLHAAGPVVIVSTGELAERMAETAHQVGVPLGEPECGAVPSAAQDPAQVVHAVLAEVLTAVPTDHQRDLRADGLESLTILQLVTRLRAALRVPIPLADAMRSLTVAGLEDLATRAVGAADERIGECHEHFRITPVPAAGRYPTSSVQRRWLNLLDQGYGGLDITVEVTGRVETAALAGAVEQVIDRHTGLRTVFHRVDGTWMQAVRPARPVTVADLSGLPAGRREAELSEFATRVASTPIEVGERPPFEIAVARLGPGRHVLVLHGHHVVFDGWSSSLFFTDVARAVKGKLPPRPLQYADYAVAQTAHLTSGGFTRTRDYWRAHFAGSPGPTRVSADAGGDPADRGTLLEFSLGKHVGTALREQAKRYHTTPFTLMMSAFGILLHGLTGQTDLVVGTTAAGRPTPQTEQIVGVFVNPLPIRLRLDPAAPVGRFLEEVHGVLVGFHEHGHYPLEDLVATVEPFAGAGLNDTFHCYLLYQNYWRPQTGDLTFRPLTLATERHHKLMRELEIVLADSDGELRGELWYLPSRFSSRRVRAWIETYRNLLRTLACDSGSIHMPVAGLFSRWAGSQR